MNAIHKTFQTEEVEEKECSHLSSKESSFFLFSFFASQTKNRGNGFQGLSPQLNPEEHLNF